QRGEAHRPGQPGRRAHRAVDLDADDRGHRASAGRPADRPGRLAHDARRQHPAGGLGTVPRRHAAAARADGPPRRRGAGGRGRRAAVRRDAARAAPVPDADRAGPLLVLVAAGAAAFAARERRARDPFIDLGVLAGNAPLLLTYGRALLAYVVAYSFLYGYT